jgi:hypothetical protein
LTKLTKERDHALAMVKLLKKGESWIWRWL